MSETQQVSDEMAQNAAAWAQRLSDVSDWVSGQDDDDIADRIVGAERERDRLLAKVDRLRDETMMLRAQRWEMRKAQERLAWLAPEAAQDGTLLHAVHVVERMLAAYRAKSGDPR